MKYTSLDKVVKGYLLQRRYPLHFYIDFLMYAKRCFDEISFDSLGNIRSVKLTINDYAAVTLPDDYMEWTKIGIARGSFVQPLHQRNSINRLNNYDSDSTFDSTFDDSFAGANKILYPELFQSYGSEYSYFKNFAGTDYGGTIDYADGFKVLPERNEIQLQGAIYANEIILEYISDGSEIDNATQITPYATSTLEAFINWKLKENGRSFSEGERMRAQRQFEQQHRILRARMDPLTISDIKQIIYRNTLAAPK